MKDKRRLLGSVILAVLIVALAIVPILAVTASAADTTVTFNLGANGSASHNDGSSKTSYSETVSGYTLNITNVSNFYTGARDAKGNSCFKLGTSSKTGSFTISNVPDDVTSVVIYAGQYKANTSKVTVNGTNYTLSGSSNNGAYDAITVDTTSKKTVTFATASGGVRCMVNTIEFVIADSGSSESCIHANTSTATVPATKGEAGSITTTCKDCGEVVKTEAIPALGYSISFIVPDGAVAPTLPDTISAVMPEGPDAPDAFNKHEYEFAGWAKAVIDGETATAPTIYRAGSTVAITEDTTFYAVYTWSVGDTSAWELVTDASSLAVGKQIVIVASGSDKVMSTTQNGNNRGETTCTKADGKVTFGDAAQLIVLEEGTVSGTFAFNVGNGYLYAASSSSNYLRTQETKDANGSWKITITESGVATIQAQGGNTRNLFMYNDTNKIFACYGSGQKDVSIYMLTSGTSFYATTLGVAVCQHTSTSTSTIDPTCTDAGSETITCNDCNEIVGYEEIAPRGHSWGEGVQTTDPTCTVKGVSTFTCSNCDNVKTEAVDIIEHNYGDDNLCTMCGKLDPMSVDYSGRYYVATIRTSGNYFWMTYDLGTASTKRYQAVDTELTKLPGFIPDSEDLVYVFVLVKNDDGTYYMRAEGVDGDNYLYMTSNNGGAFTSEDNAQKLSVDKNKDGTFNIHFIDSDAERYLALNDDSRYNYFAWYTGECKDLSLVPVISEPTIIGAQVNVGVDLAIKYHVYLPEGYDIADFVLKITNAHGTVTEIADAVSNGNNTYVFTYDGIAPQCMSDLIDAELISGGKVVDSVMEYSIVKNAKNLASAKGATDKLKKLLADLLAYGKAAQAYVGDDHGIESYVTDEDIAAIGVAPSTAAPDENINEANRDLGDPKAPEQAYISGAGVRFGNEVQIYVSIKGDNAASAKVELGEEFYNVASVGGKYVVYLPGMSITEISEPLYIKLYIDGVDEPIHNITYGAYAYVYQMITKDPTAPIAKLAQALYNFAESANNYITEA